MSLASELVLGSLHNLRIVIRYYNKQNEQESYKETLDIINKCECEIKECESYERLLLLEAEISFLYYSCFDLFIRPDAGGFSFDKRSRRPPRIR